MTTEAHNSRASTSDAFRSNGMAGPNGRTLSYSFGTSGGINDYLNRVSAINDTTSGTTALASYMYLGLGTVVRITYPQPSVWLDLWGGTSGTFNGFDLFGRITDQRWQKSITGTPTDIDRYQYGYDLNSNRLYKANVVGTAAVTAGLDEFYTYDPLNRLTEMQRGVLNSGKTGITGTPSVEQDWTLDPVGNWSGFVTKASGTTNLNQTRTANKVNEITNITESTGPTWIVPAYDAAGNTITMPQPAIPTSSFNAVYDAWNRMVSISAASTPVGKYQYDGRNFRIVKQTYSGGTLSQTRDFYFTANWQDIEEDVAGSLADQYVWGIRYIDELICRDDPTYGRLYATQDANFNVTSITDTGGSVQERYLFDPYGNRTIMNSSWVTITTSTYYWALGPWCLMIHLESGLVYGRLRYLQPLIGWTARDRLGYGDGPNLYEYCRSAPIRYVDPFGTVTCDEARKCQAGCIRFYARSKNCKDVRYGPGVSGTMQGDDARNQALTDCLNSCRNQGYPFNNVSLADCAPAPACPAPSKPEPPESDAKKVAPHLAATVAEQGARFTAEKAGAEGGSDIIGPAATIAGGLEVAPDAIRILINVAGRKYMTNHAGEVKDNEWGCDPGYLGTLTLSTSFDNLAWLATAVEQNAVPLPS